MWLVVTVVIGASQILTEARLIECHVEGPLSLIALSFVLDTEIGENTLQSSSILQTQCFRLL